MKYNFKDCPHCGINYNADTFNEDNPHKCLMTDIKKNVERLQHEYDTTRGLWCIDRKPEEVDLEWIRRNAFQLK